MKHVPKFLCEDGVFRYPDGREVCKLDSKKGMDEYISRKRTRWDQQGKRCALQISDECKKRQGQWPFDEVVFGHESSRGMGGGSRDDRIVVDGKPHNYAICPFCNSLQGSRRIAPPEDISTAI